ncbi:hypothetical protein ACFLV4_00830 [Chloroflexota bacterium]
MTSVRGTQRISREVTRIESYLRKISRLSAWALLVAVIALVVSGWGITHTEIIYKASFGLIDRRVANSIHRLTHVPFAVLLLTHVLIRVKLSLSPRYLSKVRLVNVILVGLGVALLALVFFIEYFA